MSNSADRLNIALTGRYRRAPLGEGGMASVYLAEDVKHDRKVAVRHDTAERCRHCAPRLFVTIM